MARILLLASEFGDNIFTRNSISDFFEKINSLKNDEITLDFKSVKFISRSCADEYLKQKKISKKEIVEVNMSKDVCKMFRNVENQYVIAGLKVSSIICPKKDLVLA